MRVHRAVLLRVPPARAWSILTRWEQQTRWIPDAHSVRVLTEHREGVGVILAVRTRVLGIPALTDRLEVAVWEPPRRLVVAHRGLVRGLGVWLLEPERDGTRFRWVESLRLPVPLIGEAALRAYRPFMTRLMGRALAELERVARSEAGGSEAGERGGGGAQRRDAT